MKKLILLFMFMTNVAAYAQTHGISQLIYKLRDPETKAPQFRESLEKVGEYLALELLNELSSKETTIETITGAKATHLIVDVNPVLVTILRAGLPLNAGVLKVFPNAKVGFLAMSRDEQTFKAKVEYIALPDLKNQYVIITDSMLATGGSLINAIKLIEEQKPKKIFVISAIVSEQGVAQISEHNPNIKIFAGVIDPILNEKKYIVPGLGDAGDRSFGLKFHQH
jgi:uracil phosphoribosyltransferase